MFTEIRRRLAYRREKFKAVSFSELFFVDFKILGALLLVLALIIAIFAPYPLEFHTPSIDTQRVIVDSLITTLSILFGIVFSFTVLSFNVFNKHFGRYVFVEFFRNNPLKRPFTLLLGTILILIFIKATLRETDFEDSYSTALYWLALSLSMTCLLTLFPSIISVLKNAQSRNKIRDIVQRLNNDIDLEEFEVKYLDKRHDIYYKNPIILLTEIGFAAIKEYDVTTITMIVKECLEHFKRCAGIEDENKRKAKLSVYVDFTTLYLDLFNFAVKERNSNVATIIMRTRFEMEDFILDNLDKVQLSYSQGRYHSWHLQFDMERYFDRAIQFNEDDVCKEIIEDYREYISHTIRVLLPKGFNCKQKTDCILQADPVTENFSKLNFFVDKLLYYKKYKLYAAVCNTFFTITGIVLEAEFDNTGKDHLLTVLANNEYGGFEKFITNGDTRAPSYQEIPFKRLSYSDNGADYLLDRFLRSIDLMFYQNKLNYIVLNSLRADTFNLLRKMKETAVDNRKKIQACIGKYERLGSFVTIDSTQQKKEMYIMCKSCLDLIKEYTFEIGFNDEDVERKLSTAIDSFIHYRVFLKELQDNGYIFDEKIV